MFEGLRSIRSRRAYSCGPGAHTARACQIHWDCTVAPKSPILAREMSTSSSTTESRYGVTQTTEEVTPGSFIATIILFNPKKMNIVNSSILDELIKTCQELSKIESLRAVVLTGGATAEGKSSAFIGGADIKEMHALSSSQDAKSFIDKIHRACQALRDLPVPVIGRVHGFSLGAGLEIMAACDLRIATKDSTFGMPEVKVGIPSVVEAALLPGLIGMGRTRRLLYLAENIAAKEALEWGLIEKVVDHEAALDMAVKEWATSIARMGPKSIRIQKKLIQSWEDLSTKEAIEAGVEAFAQAYEDDGKEPKEFLAKFISRKRGRD